MDSRHTRSDLPEGIHLPAPSYQPILVAVGAVLIAIGVIWTPIISVIGLLLMVLAITAWTQENRLAGPLDEETDHD
jgi:cytochrome c oxidase subunit 1